MKYLLVILFFAGSYAEGLWYQQGAGEWNDQQRAAAIGAWAGALAGAAAGGAIGFLGAGFMEVEAELKPLWASIGMLHGGMAGIAGGACYHAFKEKTARKPDKPMETS